MKAMKRIMAVVLVLALAIIAVPGIKAQAAIEYTTTEVFAYEADEFHGITKLNSTTPAWKNYAWIKFNAEADTIQLDVDVLAKIATIDYVFTGNGSVAANMISNTKAAGGWGTDAITIAPTTGKDFTYTYANANGAAAAAEAVAGDRYFNFCIQTTGDVTGEIDIKQILLKDTDGNAVITISNPAFAAAESVIPADGIIATANGTLDPAILEAAASGSKLVVEYVWPTGASADVGWGVGGICFDGWTVDPAFEAKIPEGATRDGKLVVEFDLADIIAKGAAQVNINMYNGIDSYTVTLVQPDAVPTTGDATPVAAIALVAVVALCGMVVVNRKKAYR